MEGAEPGGFLGRAPAWGRHCLCSGDRDSTAHTQQCCMQTELWEGGNKILDFFFNFFFSFPLPGWCSPEEEVYGRRQLEGFVPLLSAEEMPAASSDQCTGRRTES